MNTFRKRVLRAIFAAAIILTGSSAFAQSYPDRPVRLIIPFPVAGPTDIIGRLVAERLSALLGQQFVVENHGGANGVIGTNIVATAHPDGYTLLLSASGPLASGLSIYHGVPYNPVRNLEPISVVAKSYIVLVASTHFPPKTFRQFIRVAKASRKGVTAELNSIGSMHHLLTALLRQQTGANLIFVPYKGSGPAIVDLIDGHVDVGFESLPGVISYIRSKKLRPYAVATDKRLPYLPNVPTLRELGFHGYVAEPWFAMAAPAGTPHRIIDKLSAALSKVAKMPIIKKRFAALGMVPVWQTPTQTSHFLKTEVARWATIVKETHAKQLNPHREANR